MQVLNRHVHTATSRPIQTYYDLSGRDPINRLREIVGSASHEAEMLIWFHTVLSQAAVGFVLLSIEQRNDKPQDYIPAKETSAPGICGSRRTDHLRNQHLQDRKRRSMKTLPSDPTSVTINRDVIFNLRKRQPKTSA